MSMNDETRVLPVYIGWDAREPAAAEVCKSSLIKNSSIPLHVQFLNERPLRHAGLYKRSAHYQGAQRYDAIDGKPFSTEFSFTRFLVPALQLWSGWALFVDCDFMFNADIAGLVEQFDGRFAAMVAKQHYRPSGEVKMDGQRQEGYHRKCWSAFMALNCGHPSNKMLTVQAVNEEDGEWLHGFRWLTDDEIGGIDPRWNWIDGCTEGKPPLAVHYTTGGPWFPHLRDSALPYCDAWRREARRIGVWDGSDKD
jgi:hypothetical protein